MAHSSMGEFARFTGHFGRSAWLSNACAVFGTFNGPGFGAPVNVSTNVLD